MQSHLDGIKLVRCASWDEFLSNVRYGATIGNKRWFRGQHSIGFGLCPTLFRDGYDAKEDGNNEGEAWFLDRFRKSVLAQPRYRRLGSLTDLEWWSLAQHHGMPTPLLDWSVNPYVAAFFAITGKWIESNPSFAKPKTNTFVTPSEPVAVWELLVPDAYPPKLSDLKIYEETAISNPRQRAQGGRFTRITGGAERDLISFLRARSALELLRVYEINGQETATAFSDFQLMNISFATLFPDIDGMARNTILDSRLRWFEFLNPLGEAIKRQALQTALRIEP